MQGWASRVQKECSFNPVGLENFPNSWDIGEPCQGQVVTSPNHYIQEIRGMVHTNY